MRNFARIEKMRMLLLDVINGLQLQNGHFIVFTLSSGEGGGC